MVDFVGGDPFLVVLFSLVLICPVPRSSSVFGVPYFVLFFCSFKFCVPGCYPRWCDVSEGLLSLFPL